MYCKYCGKPLSDGARFCGFCGKNQDTNKRKLGESDGSIKKSSLYSSFIFTSSCNNYSVFY